MLYSAELETLASRRVWPGMETLARYLWVQVTPLYQEPAAFLLPLVRELPVLEGASTSMLVRRQALMLETKGVLCG